jgi:parvulin-like peptidyl-prolyl isomerase
LETGAVSDIVETPFGYHLIKVTEKAAERKVTFDEVKDRLRQELFSQKSNTEAQKWISSLRTEAKIEFMQVP